MIKTRFAPSPTGSLHIGSVRTILFNWLYAKHCNGQFLLRIEDTDQERSKAEHVEDILSTMQWLGLNWDGEPVFQHKNIKRHQEVVKDLLEAGKAYKCYCTQEELAKVREECQKNKETPRYNRKCRNLTEDLNKPYSVRLKSPLAGKTEFIDLIQGKCGVDNEHMDDMILLRSDGTPTYMLAVVVDDYDMEITHVIRGSEHLNNAYRQKQIYEACNWKAPEFAHVSLIHGEDGAKLSKRHGATSLNEYKNEGFLKEAILNYLLRLGFSKGENEIISMEECVKIFEIKDVRSSAARFSLAKLLNVNSIYLRAKNNKDLLIDLKDFVGKEKYSAKGWQRIEDGLDELKSRMRTLKELAHIANIYGYEDDHFGKIEETEFITILKKEIIENPWGEDVQGWLNELINKNNMHLKEVAPILRFALTNEKVAPSIFELLKILGKDLVLKRLINATK